MSNNTVEPLKVATPRTQSLYQNLVFHRSAHLTSLCNSPTFDQATLSVTLVAALEGMCCMSVPSLLLSFCFFLSHEMFTVLLFV